MRSKINVHLLRATCRTSQIMNKSNTECGIIRPTNAFTRDHIHYLEVAINNILKGYSVNLQTAVVAILVFLQCPKSIASEVLVVLRPYQNVKSI